MTCFVTERFANYRCSHDVQYGMFKKGTPYEWIGIGLAIIILDIVYYKNSKRNTLSHVIHDISRDQLGRSLLWAVWGWLTYHWFVDVND